jgi:hypothetical protein
MARVWNKPPGVDLGRAMRHSWTAGGRRRTPLCWERSSFARQYRGRSQIGEPPHENGGYRPARVGYQLRELFKTAPGHQSGQRGIARRSVSPALAVALAEAWTRGFRGRGRRAGLNYTEAVLEWQPAPSGFGDREPIHPSVRQHPGSRFRPERLVPSPGVAFYALRRRIVPDSELRGAYHRVAGTPSAPKRRHGADGGKGSLARDSVPRP